MRKIDQDTENAIISCCKHGGNWFKSNTMVTTCGSRVEVTYISSEERNTIFSYDLESKDFWFNDCGWPSLTSRNRINDCLRACKIPCKVFISKSRFCVKDLNTGKSWICGDGKVTKALLEVKLAA